MTTYKLPLTPEPQAFEIQLGNKSYSVQVLWCEQNTSWIFDLSDIQQNPILRGIPLVTGVDLFEQYEYLNLGGQLRATTTGDATSPPTFENLGTLGIVYFITP
jgi:hypothetical protein